jgi:hypothetical protein
VLKTWIILSLRNSRYRQRVDDPHMLLRHDDNLTLGLAVEGHAGEVASGRLKDGHSLRMKAVPS